MKCREVMDAASVERVSTPVSAAPATTVAGQRCTGRQGKQEYGNKADRS